MRGDLRVCIAPNGDVLLATARAAVFIPIPVGGETAVRLWLHSRPALGGLGVHYGALEVVRVLGDFVIKQTLERTTVLQGCAATVADLLVEAEERFSRAEEALQAAAREMNRAWAAAQAAAEARR